MGTLAMMVMVAESTVFITGGGLALAGLLGLKAALFGGVLIGAAASRRRHYTHKPSRKSYSKSYKTHKYRYGRSIEDEEIIDENEALSNAILDASLNDAEDCAKKLICSLNAKEVSTLASDESAIAVAGPLLTAFFGNAWYRWL